MGSLEELPTELREFLASPPPQTLLIRGLPGTGKTILSLSILAEFPGKRIFITSRVGPDRLRAQFPWYFGALAANGGLIDATQRLDSMRERVGMVHHAREFPSIAGSEATVDDAWVPGPLIEAFRGLGAKGPAMVVTDSWDALIEQFVGSWQGQTDTVPDRAEIERIVFSMLPRFPATFVFVSEHETIDQLDYLADGILRTTRAVERPAQFRWLQIAKLRGIRVLNPSYPFTLEGGRFRCIRPLPRLFRARLVPSEPDPQPVPGFIWPGSAEYANWFGRLRFGQITLIERDDETTHEACRLFLSPILSHVLSSGGRVFDLLPPGGTPEEVGAMVGGILGADRIPEHVRMIAPTGELDVPKMLQPAILPRAARGMFGSQEEVPEAVRFLDDDAARATPSVALLWSAGLRYLATEDGLPLTGEDLPNRLNSFVRARHSHVVFVGDQNDPLAQAARSIAWIRIQLLTQHGRLFARGIEPQTPLFLVVEGEGMEPVRLLPVV